MDEARKALEDPVEGSLRVLKAIGRQRDLFSSQLMSGAIRLEVRNELELVAAEDAVKAFLAELVDEGEPPPNITIAKTRAAFK